MVCFVVAFFSTLMPVMMETCYKGRESAGSGRLRDSSPPSRRSPRHITSGDKVHYKDNKDSRGALLFLLLHS